MGIWSSTYCSSAFSERKPSPLASYALSSTRVDISAFLLHTHWKKWTIGIRPCASSPNLRTCDAEKKAPAALGGIWSETCISSS